MILLVEDDPTLRLLGAKQFEALGWPVDIAADGREAIIMSKNGYDIILMDLAMPEVSGIQAALTIRQFELENRRKRTPIIAMTAYSDREEVTAFGMDDYILKPVLLDDLKSIVKKWIRNCDENNE